MPSNYKSFKSAKMAPALGLVLAMTVVLPLDAFANPSAEVRNAIWTPKTGAPYMVAQAPEGEQPQASGQEQGGEGEPRRLRRRQFQEGQGGPTPGGGDADAIRRRMRQKMRQRFEGGGDPGIPPNAPGDGQAPMQGEGGPRMFGDGEMPRFRENRFDGPGGGGRGQGFRRRVGQGQGDAAEGGPGQGEFRRRGGGGMGGGMGGGGMRGKRMFGRGGNQLFGRGPLDLSALNLTEAQKTRIKEIRQQSSPRSRELMKSAQAARMGLKDMMFDPNMTDAQIRAKRAELRKLQDQSEDMMLNDFLTIRSVLTKEQKARLPQIKPQEVGPRGPGGPGGPPGGEPMEVSDGPQPAPRLQGFRGNNQD